jgi:hypothetical protein
VTACGYLDGYPMEVVPVAQEDKGYALPVQGRLLVIAVT